MNQQLTSRISIIILAVVMIIFGIYHYMYPKNLLVFVPSYIPGGIIWVYITGTAFILAAISFLLHKMVRLSAILLATMLAIFVFTIHLPNYMHAGDVEMQQMALISFLKDLAIAAFALHIASNARTV
ncbi:hypothetical protein [Aridibaculum aurantiacum]|uniref:hypothetical protein n=1 Tax=Aridibaculum aurantiacum TaxID=2810307 RepID=UPI001A95A491|nr:hypothetical protein [Aridibaculum aurantiacum]